jgi:hypothetical protein
MSFDEDGFLGAEAKQAGENYAQENKQYFAYFASVNRVSHGLVKKAELNPHHGPQVFIAGLYLRSLTVFQAAIILAERGVITELRTMVRSLYELRFQTESIFRDPIVGARLTFKAEQAEERRLKAISKQTWPDDTDPHRAQRELRLEALRHDLDRIEAKILAQRRDLAHKKGRLRPLAVRELAEIANMKTEYEIAYSHLCETTHSSARYLDEMVAYDEAGDFGGFQYQQSKQLLLVYCFTAAELHLDNLTRTVEILQLTPPPELDQLKETHRNLEEQLRRRD